MKLSFTISERIEALKLLDGFKGRLSDLAMLQDDMKLLNIKEDEWIKAERKIIENKEDNTVSWQWNDDKAGPSTMEVSKFTVDWLRDTIKKKDEAGEFTMADRHIITLKEKLNK